MATRAGRGAGAVGEQEAGYPDTGGVASITSIIHQSSVQVARAARPIID